VEACYAQVRQAPKESSVEYCFLLDQLACSIDAAMMQSLHVPQESYWQCASALARTMAAMALIQADPQARDLTLQRWAVTKGVALRLAAGQ
jgi:hypothetical protein